MDSVNSAVVPIHGALEDVSSEPGDAWRMLADGTGAHISWSPVAPGDHAESWGPVLAASSSFAKQLLAVADRAGASSAVSAGTTLFRLELPTGSTLHNLIPAVGGGFRGMVRTADGVKIAGQARLVPVSGAAVGAGLAMGPLVGLMALSVGAEMIARRQQDQMLAAIQVSVQGIERHLQGELDAKLKTAQRALEGANAAILDQVSIPQGIGLSAAVTGLNDVRHQAIGWLDEWAKRLSQLPADTTEVDYFDVRKILDVGIGGPDAFVGHVELLYRSLVLDSRAAVLSASETALANPDRTFENIEGELRRRMDENADVLQRLRTVLLGLAELRVTVGTLVWPGTASDAVRLDGLLARLAHALIQSGDVAAVLTSTNRQVLEAVRRPDGTVRICAPRVASPA